jgi:hypothetical protein
VLDAAGKPVGGARVAVAAWSLSRDRLNGNSGWSQGRVLGQGQSDKAGNFRLRVPSLTADRFREVFVLASSPGHGFGQLGWKPGTDLPRADVHLTDEQPLRGRLFDLQGKPAAGVRVAPVWLSGPGGSPKGFFFLDVPRLAADWPFGPGPATSDRDGRFTLRGLGRELRVDFETKGGGFAGERFEVTPEARKRGKEFRFSLTPARVLEGTVSRADTHQPVPGAKVRIVAHKSRFDFGGYGMIELRADRQGRFHGVPHAGSRFELIAYPPPGTAYFPLRRTLNWPAADVIKQKVDLPLPRGILVQGTVTEKPSGKPLAGASIHFTANRDNNPYFRGDVRLFNTNRAPCLTGPDGKFEIAILPGPGHLLIDGPTPDYLRTEIGNKKLYGVEVGPNRRNYVDGLLPLNLKPQQGPHEVQIVLRRGVTLRGKVVGPDGKPVTRGVLVSRAYLPGGMDFNKTSTKALQDGRFELPGCDPDKPVEVFFYDAKGPFGAVVELSAQHAARQPVTVRLQPCGTATARFVDMKGKPMANLQVIPKILMTPGISIVEERRSNKLLADTAFLSSMGQECLNDLRTDAQGRVTMPGLIPGATTWLIVQEPRRGHYDFKKVFKVQAGQTVNLGDLRVPDRS